jgi:Flp pilus assembly protein TadG
MKIGLNLRRMSNSLVRRVKRTSGRWSEEGTALVEFAVTMPLLMMVLTGTASFSLALYFLQQVGNATSSAVMSVGGEAGLFPNNDPCAAAKSFVTGALPNLAPSKLALKLVITDTTLTTDTYNGTGSSFSCTSAPAMEANYPVTLTVTYTYTWLPVLNFSPNSNLTSTQAAIQM